MTVASDRLSPRSAAGGRSGLLEQLLDNQVDPDYRAAAAARRSAARPPSPKGAVRVLATVAVFGVLLGISAVKTERDRPQALVERTRLIAAIHSRQHMLDGLHTALRAQQSRVADLQTRLAAVSSSETHVGRLASRLGMTAGVVPVRGPGFVVTVGNATDAAASSGGVIRDTDLQALVNGLWAAGAEAVAVNGHRLTTLTAIRFAGEAITVDYRSLTPPYVVEAVGNPDTLPARFLETQGGQLLLGLHNNFGIGFSTHTSSSIELPGDPRSTLLWAHPVVSR
jgi:uncharacterized protein YlxW (UPF0749 family)